VRSGLTELGDPEAVEAVTAGAGQERQGVGVPVEDGDQRGRVRGGEQLVDDGSPDAGAAPAPLLEGPEHQVRAGQADHPGGDTVAPEGRCRGDHLGHDRAHPDEGDVISGGGVRGDAVTAGDGLLASPLARRRVIEHRGQRRVERAGRQAEVHRRSALDADLGHGVEQAPLEVGGERRLPRHAALIPVSLGRPAFAVSTMAAESHSTRCATSRSTFSS